MRSICAWPLPLSPCGEELSSKNPGGSSPGGDGVSSERPASRGALLDARLPRETSFSTPLDRNRWRFRLRDGAAPIEVDGSEVLRGGKVRRTRSRRQLLRRWRVCAGLA